MTSMKITLPLALNLLATILGLLLSNHVIVDGTLASIGGYVLAVLGVLGAHQLTAGSMTPTPPAAS